MTEPGFDAHFIGGPADGLNFVLAQQPNTIDVAGFRYEAIFDPDTGAHLGAYTVEGEV